MKEDSKICRQCDRRLPRIKFDVDPTCADGRRSTCRQCRGSKQARASAPPKDEPKRFNRTLNSKRYLITCAQNSTPVHPEFFAALKVAAKHLGAELVVIPIRYKNPTSIWSKAQKGNDRWDPLVDPYLFNVRKKLGPNLVLVGDVKIQPTASSPLSGFESLTGGESCIIGHPKMQLRSVPSPSGRSAKILTTTGACTRRNFTDTKSGKIGAFHHCLGAVVVELDGRGFRLRQINADRVDGSFTDLDVHYTAKRVERAKRAIGIALGDTHARFTCPKVDRATFGPGGIVERLNPETVVFHDVVDGDTTNPHHVGNPFISEAKRRAGAGSVRAELEHVIDFVNSRCRGRKAVIVDSNHHDFLARWILTTDWKTAGPNAGFYLETAAHMWASAQQTATGQTYADPFVYWALKLGAGANIRMLGPNESFKLADVECGMHGHRGPNGARGSLKNLSRLGTKVISGHSHTPGIEEGHYQLGTSTPLRLSYTVGPSSWLNAHVVVYATGKRALIVIVDGRWTTTKPLPRMHK